MLAATFTPKTMLEKLISFDTTSRESNLALIHFVQDYLEGHGIASALIHDESGEKANLYATLGPEVDGGVVLSGHTDVVPVDGQDWASDPFDCLEKDGLLYGRGTSDMKGFIATALALVPEFLARPLKAPIHLAFSYDEEVGCIGVHGIIRHMDGLAQRPKAVIIGEPSEMTVVNAHKGICAVRTTVRGLEAHSSATHLGVNSVIYAAELIGFLNRMAEGMQSSGKQNPRFEPPHTTVHVGTIGGGTALNIIPRETRFHWEWRGLPEDDTDVLGRFEAFAAEEVLPRMQAVYPGAEIRSEVTSEVRPLVPEDGSPAETLVLALAGSNQTFAVSYGTEGGAFQAGGTPAVICGPGSIVQAHKPNEFVALSQLDACADFLGKLGDHLAEA